MRVSRISLCLAILFLLPGGLSFGRDVSTGGPDFKEVYDLLKKHLAGTTDADLNKAAVDGLISELGPKVSLENSGESSDPSGTDSNSRPAFDRISLFGGDVLYLRAGRVGPQTPQGIKDAIRKNSGTNALIGIVLDLRYSDGHDYAASAAVADLFLKKERPLLDWGQGVVRSKEKEDAITLPLTVLINHRTAGAAEALAGALRQNSVGLLLGNQTAGAAMIQQEFPLSDGEKLRIATSAVALGDGSHLETVKPDITVEVSPQDERVYYTNSYAVLSPPATPARDGSLAANAAAATNIVARRPRPSEADLVREHRDGLGAELEALTRNTEPEKPLVQDPCLARAIDVLKGLAVVRHSR